MKKQSINLLTQLSTNHLESLTSIVPETLAVLTATPASKIFTPADLWSIQRQKKGLVQRRIVL